ncbi:MAG: M48 family metalloprotease, partial [Cyanobacteria bacterium P01_H01_bin.130]
LKAALGLFQAYGESGQTAAAQALGQQLKQHKNTQVRDRATVLWDRLFPASSTPISSDPEGANPESANSGFMPLEPSADLPPPNPDFQPLSADPPSQKVNRPKIQTVSAPLPRTAIASPQPPSPPPARSTPGLEPPSASSPVSSPVPPPAPPRQRIVVDAPRPLSNPEAPPEAVANPGSESYTPHWRNGEKISHWGTLPGAPGLEYQVLQLLSVVAFGAIATVPFVVMTWFYNRCLYWFDWFPGVNYLELVDVEPWTFAWVWVLLVGILIGTPWLIDEALKWSCGGRSLRLLELNGQRPETGKILQRQCRRHKLPLPQLRFLPTPDPIIFSYGSWRSNARLVISQGALETLDDGELATLLTAELGHILTGDCRVMGWGTLVLAVPFGIYWWLGTLIERWTMPVSRATAIALSAVAYECFRLGRWPLFWLSRARVGYGDRQGVLMTGDPNGLSRALVKLAIATEKRLTTQTALPPLLEVSQMLLPVPPSQAIALGSLYPHSPLEPYLQ